MMRIAIIIAAVLCLVWPLTIAANDTYQFSYRAIDQTNYVSAAFVIDQIAENNIFLNHKAGHEADTIVLSCMDFRLISAVEKYMVKIKKEGEYDYIVLAGASLGVNNTKYPEWGLEFWEHMTLSRDLHNIKNVMIIDHRNCGAYKAFLNVDFPEKETKEQLIEETSVHKNQLDQLSAAIHQKYPFLGIQTRLMALDGTVSEIGNIQGEGAFPARPQAIH
jgi:hypothetical protein